MAYPAGVLLSVSVGEGVGLLLPHALQLRQRLSLGQRRVADIQGASLHT